MGITARSMLVKKNHILLVEDDPGIIKLLSLYLNSTDSKMSSCETAVDAMNLISAEDLNLIILDINLPDGDGMSICKETRSHHINTPILMLTSRTSESDKVLALDMGADDYLTKPFSVLELLARTRALIRRAENNLAQKSEESSIVHNDLMIDRNKRKLTVRGERIELTAKEFDLLLLLASNPGQTFSRKQLLEKLWGTAFSGYEHTITSHINRLRVKIERDILQPAYILTNWGAGYRFAE